MRHLHRYCLISVWLAATTAAAGPLTASTDELAAVCQQRGSMLACELLPRADLSIETAQITRRGAPPLQAQFLSGPGDKRYTVLLLVDTSDPGRASVVAADRDNIRSALETLDPQAAVGVARFDAELELLLPPAPASARSPQEIEAAVSGITATGRTTEFYRNLISAIRLIARSEATARAVIVMSDGLAEDSAYHHEDAVAAAHREGVTLHGIGHARSVSQSVALQTLRRLSEETGGIYLQADSASHRVPAAYFARIASALKGQRSARFDLSPLAAEAGELAAAAKLSIVTSTGRVDLPLEIRLPRPVAAAAGAATPDAEPAITPAPPPALPGPAVEPGAAPRAPLDWLALAGLLILGVYLVLRWRAGDGERPALAPRDESSAGDAPRHAFIVLADDASRRYAITRTPWRVGRSRSNDLTLDDGSVSRVHAEIHRDELGVFTIQDLDAMNGVFVNDKKVDTAVINEGDRIDIGDIGLRFTLHGEDYDAQDPTVLVRTRTPGPDAAP